jgi:hypothetical protein
MKAPDDLTNDPDNPIPAANGTPRIYRRDHTPDSEAEQTRTHLELWGQAVSGMAVGARVISSALNRPIAFMMVTGVAIGAVLALSSSSPAVAEPLIQAGLWIVLVLSLFGLVRLGLRFVEGPRRTRRARRRSPRGRRSPDSR